MRERSLLKFDKSKADWKREAIDMSARSSGRTNGHQSVTWSGQDLPLSRRSWSEHWPIWSCSALSGTSRRRDLSQMCHLEIPFATAPSWPRRQEPWRWMRPQRDRSWALGRSRTPNRGHRSRHRRLEAEAAFGRGESGVWAIGRTSSGAWEAYRWWLWRRDPKFAVKFDLAQQASSLVVSSMKSWESSARKPDPTHADDSLQQETHFAHYYSS